jgi:predicted transcriptional regulator
MRKSKLAVYQDILERLKSKALSLDGLSFEAGVDCMSLKQKIGFLVENGLVRERMLKGEIRFAVSSKGLAVLRALEVQRHFDMVKTALKAFEDPLQAKAATARRRPDDV